MGFVDLTTGNPVDNETASGLLKLKSRSIDPKNTIPPPPNFVREAGDAIVRNAIPTLGMTGAAEGLGALGVALAPESGGLSLAIPAGLAAFGSGAANVIASKELPESLGGNPKASAASDFFWGALPELALGGLGRKAGRAGQRIGEEALQKEGTDTYTKMGEALKPKDATASTARDLASTIARPSLAPPRSLTLAEGGGLKANQYRDAVTGPIDRLRNQYGSRIGTAYKDLKSPHEPADVGGIQANVQAIRESMVSPISPSAEKLLRDAAAMEPMAPSAKAGGRSIVDTDIELPGGGMMTAQDLYRQSGGKQTPEQLRAAGLTEKQIQTILSQPSAGGATTTTEGTRIYTRDDVRNLRQKVDAQLRNAQGGDRRALSMLRTDLDNRLVNYFPDNMGELRRDYKNFIRRFPYSDINTLDRAHSTREVGQYVFGGADRAHTQDIIANSTPKERPILQAGFADHVLRDVDPDMPIKDQVAVAQKAMRPYVQDGTVKRLFGPKANLEARNLMYAPIQREYFAKKFAQPDVQKSFEQTWLALRKNKGVTATNAAEQGFEAFVNQLPPEEQQALRRFQFQRSAVSGANLPMLLPPEEMTRSAIREKLLTNATKSGIEKSAGRRAQFMVPYAASRMAMGGGAGYAIGMGGTLATIAASKAGWRAALNLGAADGIARLYASSTGRQAALAAFDMFSAIGSRAGQNLTGGSDDSTTTAP